MKRESCFLLLPAVLLMFMGCDKSDNVQQTDIETVIEHVTVATMNVDGLPVSVDIGGFAQLIRDKVPEEYLDGNILLTNPDGPGAGGSVSIGQKIKVKGWDVFGLNEDFNYHRELWQALDNYSGGKYLGKIETDDLTKILKRFLKKERLFSTDGLGIGVKRPYSVRKEIIRPWVSGALYGYVTNSGDELTDKGFRYYLVQFDTQTYMDFIILHADAGSATEDVQAREIGMKQLYDFITTCTSTDNPLITMGDFNCYYRRDRLKELLLDRINAVPGLEAHDAWVEYSNGGVYPEYSSDIVTDGELLDKIIYVNRREASFQLRLDSATDVMDFTDEHGSQLSDHYPLQASFSIERR